MTVANLREPPGADYLEAVFLESARFYRLPMIHPAYDEARALLHEALAQGRLVEIALASIDAETIEEVRRPGP